MKPLAKRVRDRARRARSDRRAKAVSEARGAIKEREWDRAIRELRRLTKNGGSAEEYALLASALAKSGDVDAAEVLVEDALSRFPADRSLVLTSAEVSMKARDWEGVLSRLEPVVADHSHRKVPPRALKWCATAARHHAVELARGGDAHPAHELLDRLEAAGPDRLRLPVARAALLFEEGRWAEVVHVLDQPVDDRIESLGDAFTLRVRAHRRLREGDRAWAAVVAGLELFPDSASLAFEYAFLAGERGAIKDAIARLERVRANPDTPAAVLASVPIVMASVFDRSGDLAAAERVLAEARAAGLRDLRVDLRWAEVALWQHDAPEAERRFEQMIDEFGEGVVPAEAFVMLSDIYRRSGRAEVAGRLLQRAEAAQPGQLILTVARAELAMASRAWSEATRLWERALALAPDSWTLPLRSEAWDWNEAAWLDLAASWSVTEPPVVPGPDLCLAVGELLDSLGEHGAARDVFVRGLTHEPAHRRLRLGALLSEFDVMRPAVGEPVAGVLDSTLAHEVGDLARDHEPLVKSAEDALASLAPSSALQTLPPVRRLRIPRGTTAEVMVRRGRIFTQRAVRDAIGSLSEHDQWPELASGTRPLRTMARRWADEFGRRYAEDGLSSDALAAAVLHPLYSELCVFEPARRLAASVARDLAGSAEPVFVDVTGAKLTYLSQLTQTGMAQFYLGAELRRRGVNFFFVEFANRDPAQPAAAGERAMVVSPSPGFSRQPFVSDAAPPPPNAVALVPSQIRAVRQVAEIVGDPLVIDSGHVIGDFAYDRVRAKRLASHISVRQDELLSSVSIALRQVAELPAMDLVRDGPVTIVAEESDALGRTWFDWFCTLVHPWIREMAERAAALAEARDVRTIHVADHVSPESVICAAAVKERGGHVVLWPHSSNPIDVDTWWAGGIDQVTALTTSGAREWEAAFPEALVRIDPSLMLPRPRRRPVDPTQPLSVVVIGSRNVVGEMPLVHMGHHTASVRALFEGLGQLQQSHGVRIHYRPKGAEGENEFWLERLAGGLATWELMSEHPMRVELPNMVFVAVSVASTAILEGIGRGIPGLVARDFDAPGYTTVGDAVPCGPVPEILDVIRACTSPDDLERLAERQLAYYCDETGYEMPSWQS